MPDAHLDARPSYFPENHAINTVAPFEDVLLKAYVDVVHPSYSILDIKDDVFERLPLLLRVAMYVLALPFCTEAKECNQLPLFEFLHQGLPIAARNTKLGTIEAALLFLQRQAPTTRFVSQYMSLASTE